MLAEEFTLIDLCPEIKFLRASFKKYIHRVRSEPLIYGHPEMILRFDFSLIIVSLGDPAVADFSKHYVENPYRNSRCFWDF